MKLIKLKLTIELLTFLFVLNMLLIQQKGSIIATYNIKGIFARESFPEWKYFGWIFFGL
jgi:hypothetical protein